MINKKGSIMDLFLVIVVVFACSIAFVVSYGFVNDVLAETQAQIGGNTHANETLQAAMDATETFDYVVVAIFAGLIIATILSAFLINVHPAFLWLFLLVTMLAIIVSVPLSNAYQLANMTSKSSFPLTSFIMNNLPVLTLIVGVFAVVVVYAKSRFGR